MARRKTVPSDNNLTLPLTAAESSESLQFRGVFSPTYINNRLRNSSEISPEDEVRPVYEEIKKLWHGNYAGLRKRDEAYTRTRFIDPILQALGWSFIPETNMPGQKGARMLKRPDYCLFPTTAVARKAAECDQVLDLFRLSTSVLEAKKVGHNLDDASRRETPGWFPSQQIQDYLDAARDPAGQRFFNWAILSNGNEWRLYTERAARDAYFSIRIAQDDLFCDFADFQIFHTLFRAQAFVQAENGRALLDDIQEESLSAQARLEGNLQKRVFVVLEDLATGFYNEPRNNLSEADLPTIYHHSLIFLYRLLFVLYAESRDLLPIKRSRAGANARYRDTYSLSRHVGLLRNKAAFSSNDDDRLYSALLDLFLLINGADARRNRLTEVTQFNGGLFSVEIAPELDTWRIGDKDLADVLRQLIFAQPPAQSRQQQQQIFTEEAIDYATLEVRQLGDIYEGLLSAHLDPERDRLTLKNEKGQRHGQGIFYTPDWVVGFLVRETLGPLLQEIEDSAEVQLALKGKTEEAIKNDAFARAVLQLDLCDPAMGSGHFLVRATEFLAEEILYHPTTRLKTEKVVKGRSSDKIKQDGLLPVSPGLSQEQAEIAFWRRRVVESCVYGVDLNPLAVELAKLSLWLTCIATDEPLNFLDHHLTNGNSLLFAAPENLGKSPDSRDNDSVFPIHQALGDALADAIQNTVKIEEVPNTELDLVKQKERLWGKVRERLEPFLRTADLWLAIREGLPVGDFDYLSYVTWRLSPDSVAKEERESTALLAEKIEHVLKPYRDRHLAFHWKLRFPGVFFDDAGRPLPEDQAGFDAILGNPPYISNQTQSGSGDLKPVIQKLHGYSDDLYVHFTDLGFSLLRQGGGFGFIVSDTFFTLATKLRMRERLQDNRIAFLGQCDPFDATVDAAIFVAFREPPSPDGTLTFIQARPQRLGERRRSRPELALPKLTPAKVEWSHETRITLQQASPKGKGDGQDQASLAARHDFFDGLRLHKIPQKFYRHAHKRAFFEPRPGTLKLFERFNRPMAELVEQWWDKIETSKKFANNIEKIRAYHQTLRPGDVTLVGLIAEGGQGMRTANNARFLAYLEGTPQAKKLTERAHAWNERWMADPRVRPEYEKNLREAGGDPDKPLANRAAWEAAVHRLREQFTPAQIGFTKTSLFRIAPKELIATEADFQFTWESRRKELLTLWQQEGELAGFWQLVQSPGDELSRHRHLLKSNDADDADFCTLCTDLLAWFHSENTVRRKKNLQTIPKSAVHLRSAEYYDDPADVPRIATIYNGLSGQGIFVPFRKGDSEGNRWISEDPLLIDWTTVNVEFLFQNSGKKAPNMPVVRNPHLYFTKGVTWTRVANHVGMKARLQPPCVFDSDSVRLTPMISSVPSEAFLALFNSDLLSFLKMKFLQHTAKWEIGNLRQLPVVVPTTKQARLLKALADLANTAKKATFHDDPVSQETIATAREWRERLSSSAPDYLRPPAQLTFAEAARDCLEIFERAINWEAEKLYGVEGWGPFDDF